MNLARVRRVKREHVRELFAGLFRGGLDACLELGYIRVLAKIKISIA